MYTRLVSEQIRPLEESESSLTSDLEFVLPDDIPEDAERIPLEDPERQAED